MDFCQNEMEHFTVDGVPWRRLTTTYGSAADFPAYFKDLWDMQDMAAAETALREIEHNTEHQSTLWHATPFAVVFLIRIFSHALRSAQINEIACYIVNQLLDFFIVIARCVQEGESRKHADPLPCFSDLLKEQYLWPEESDGDDEAMWEEAGCYPDDLFYSFYFYSHQALLYGKKIFEQAGKAAFGKKAEQLLACL